MRFDWRTVYWLSLMTLGAGALLTPYPLTYNTFLIGEGLSLAVLLYLAVLAYHLWAVRPERPLSDFIQARGAPAWLAVERVALLASGTLFLAWLPPLKTMIPAHSGFWADPLLARIDRLLLGGRDAFDLVHAITPDAATRFIDFGYTSWLSVIVVAMTCTVILGRNAGRFMIAWALSWTLLGVGLASLLASAGPIFGPDLGFGFERVHERLEGTVQMKFHDILWSAHASGGLQIGGGISAAPSMHCAIAFLLFFAAKGTSWRIPAFVYAAFIWFGSVYLGWHYAVDGLLSLIGVALIWRVSERLAAPRYGATTTTA